MVNIRSKIKIKFLTPKRQHMLYCKLKYQPKDTLTCVTRASNKIKEKKSHKLNQKVNKTFHQTHIRSIFIQRASGRMCMKKEICHRNEFFLFAAGLRVRNRQEEVQGFATRHNNKRKTWVFWCHIK